MTTALNFSRLQVPGVSEEDCAVLVRAGTYEYYCQLIENLRTGYCPFCTIDPEINRVELENRHWRMWQNIISPEANTATHLLLVPKRHVLSIRELSQGERRAWFQILTQSFERHNISSSGIFSRDGDATLSAGTVRHLHWHLIEPDGTGRVEVTFFKGAASEAEGNARAILFERLRTGQAVLAEFTEDEMRLLTDKKNRLKGYKAA